MSFVFSSREARSENPKYISACARFFYSKNFYTLTRKIFRYRALRSFDRKRAGKKMSNEQWQNPHDPDAKIGRTKDG